MILQISQINKFITASMITTNFYNASERSPKVGTPTSPQTKRKNIDFALHSPLPTPNSTA